MRKFFDNIKHTIIGSRVTCYIMRHGFSDWIYARFKYGKNWYDNTNRYYHIVKAMYPELRLEKYRERLSLCLRRSSLKELENVLAHLLDHTISDFEPKYQKALLLIKKANASSLHLADWAALESLCIAEGLFRLALECHKKYWMAVKKRKKGIFNGFSKLGVLLEEGHGQEADKELCRLEKKWIYQKLRNRTLYMARLYCNALNHVPQTSIPCLKEDSVTCNYRKYLKDKKILIIAPAPTEFSNSNYDCIIRINDAKNIHAGDGLKNEKTDVSYFWDLTGGFIADSKDFSTTKFAVIKNHYNISEKYKNTRGTICPSDILPIGHFNMVPVIVLDLLRFTWSELHITGANLYIDTNTYVDYYRDAPNTECILNSEASHNAFCQFFFLQNMFKANVFIPDKQLKDILSHSAFHYACEMEKAYLMTYRRG